MTIEYSEKNRLVGRRGGRVAFFNLNLIFDYPVRWSRYKVLRDLIQNFYDALGHTHWQQRFRWRIDGGGLYLTAEDVGFSYEWLLHIGASTKRDTPGKYAGYFGEGFKIAALCALRDFGWQLEVLSRDWELKVLTSSTEVEGRPLKTLAYRVWQDVSLCPDTELCLFPFDERDKQLLETVLLSFYYEQNPLLGEVIWKSDEGAIHLRSATAKPTRFPSTERSEGEGIVFTGYQALGSLRYPLAVALHNHRSNDRERGALYRMDVIDVLKSVARRLSPKAARAVLEVLSPEWYRYPQKRYDFDCYYPIVRALVIELSRDRAQADRFRRKYPHMVVAERVARKDVRRYNRRRQALTWMRKRPERYRLVQDGFLRLGYPTLESLCEADNGFSVVRPPTPAECKPLSILEETAHGLFGDLLGSTALPPCRILKSDSGVWMGMAECVPIRGTERKESPDGRRFELPYVALKGHLLTPGLGGEALGTYLHELAHMFGSDGSAHFSQALTDVLSITIERAEDIEAFKRRWDEACQVTINRNKICRPPPDDALVG